MKCRQLVVALSLCAMPCFAAEGQSEDRLLFGVLQNVPFTIQEKDKASSGLYVELLATIIEHAKIDATRRRKFRSRDRAFACCAAALMKALAEGVRLAKADGSIDAIVKKYGQ